MSFPRYPKYKDSGVEWLGQVPEHWGVISIKWLSPVKRGASPRPIDDPRYFDDKGEFAWVRIADVSACDGVLKETTQQLSELGSSLSVKIAPGELFVSIAGTVGKPCLSAIKACIHDGFVYFSTLKIDPQFLYWIFEAGTCYGGLGKWGTQLNLNTDTIGSIRITLPTPEELKYLLAFLERETAKIDELVAKQERLMALLKEKRQAVISHAVTKGLNNSDVPLRRLKFLVDSIETGFTPNSYGHPAQAGQCGVLKSGCVNHGVFDPEENKLLDEKVDPPADLEVKAGDILMSRASGSSDLIGSVALVHETPLPRLFLSDKTFRVSQKRELVEAEFFVWAMNSRFLRTQISQIISGADGLAKNIAQSNIRELLMPVPAIDVQKAIVCFIRKEVQRFDTLTAEAQRAIDLLQERRTALISAAVTGQIDIRNQ